MSSSDEAEKLFRRYRREAVLLHRAWPPHAGPPTNSRFGGLPNLPTSLDWPRASNGTPLHFLAQIDCADIGFKTALPQRGVLFFFGRDDDEQIWDMAPPASDDCRVLYALDAFALTPPRQPPMDLPPIGGYYGAEARGWAFFRMERDERPNVHVAWPVVPRRFDSFPDASALPELIERAERSWRRFLEGRFWRGLRLNGDDGDEALEAAAELYEEQLNARRVAALVAATGAPPPGSAEDIHAGNAILGSAASGPESFPQHWANIHYLARAILYRPRNFAHDDEESARIAAEAEHWLARSRQVPLHQPVGEDDRQAVRTWIVGLKTATDPSEFGHRAARLAFLSAYATIRIWAGDPALAALVPAGVYAACAPYFYGYQEEDPMFSQMLGHAPSAQDALPADAETICLLNLDTDRGVGWSFGDGGRCAFWITPRDLARRDFSKVEGTIVGH